MNSPLPTCAVAAPPLVHSPALCRLLPWAVGDGAANMAADETLLGSAAAGVASLRFYAWSEPTLSIGYFQAHASRHNDELVGELPYVRRPSGGDALLHHHEITYALALPALPPWQADRPSSWLCRVHAAIQAGLDKLGIATASCEAEHRTSRFLCFGHHTRGDLLIGAAKIVGSAQRRLHGAVMQHGAILLARSPQAPGLPGIAELTGKKLDASAVCATVVQELARVAGWTLDPAEWRPAENERIRILRETKYRQASWNDRR